MDRFTFLGSKGGAGRTASSVLLAIGLSELGLRPLHLQVTMYRCPPAIGRAQDAPFATDWLSDEEASAPSAIQQRIARHPECMSVVIDMPARRITQGILYDIDGDILLPMLCGTEEIEATVRDYREIRTLAQARSSSGGSRAPQQLSAWIVPVSWPLSLRACDFASILSRYDEGLPSGNHHPLIHPGISYIPKDDLDELINENSFLCTPLIQDVAWTIAQSVLERTNKSRC